jgi:NTE family protein
MTLEIGNVYQEQEPVSLETLRTAGSIFVGADTVIGPAFVGWGISEGGRRRIYLSIGRRI